MLGIVFERSFYDESYQKNPSERRVFDVACL